MRELASTPAAAPAATSTVIATTTACSSTPTTSTPTTSTAFAAAFPRPGKESNYDADHGNDDKTGRDLNRTDLAADRGQGNDRTEKRETKSMRRDEKIP
jgi:hypothetical protein